MTAYGAASSLGFYGTTGGASTAAAVHSNYGSGSAQDLSITTGFALGDSAGFARGLAVGQQRGRVTGVEEGAQVGRGEGFRVGRSTGYTSGHAQGLLDADTTTPYTAGYTAGHIDGVSAGILAAAPEPVAPDTIDVVAPATAIDHIAEALARLAEQYKDEDA